MKLRYFFVVFALMFAAVPAAGLAHNAPLDEDGCHECRTEEGCSFYDYWSVPYAGKHCHPERRATSTVVLEASVAPTSSVSSTVVREDKGLFALLLSPASWFQSLPRLVRFLLVILVFSLLYVFWRLFRKKEEE
ncbi:MAG: hypothetical protein Q8P01_05385 [bacterium]|nr:hypothetical protein [bacterium]